SGAMGGSASEEFLAVSPHGEDTFVRCEASGYAANVEAVVVPQAAPVEVTAGEARAVETPESATIDALVDVLNRDHARADGRAWTAADTLKNVLVMLVHPDGTREPLCIGVPGDREIDDKRLEAQVTPAEVAAFEEKDFAAHPALVKGYLGPQVFGAESASGIRYLIDPSIAPGSAWVTGANEAGRHTIDAVYGRDFTADGTIQAAEVKEGDPSPDGAGPLTLARGIEMGHIFQLGRKYAEALGLQVLDENGKLVTVTMGSYGVGVSRAVAAVAEGTCDEIGLCWPRSIAPADVHVVATGKDAAVYEAGESITAQLEAAGLEVIYDDRPKVSPGVKFKDSELIGIPTIVVIGKGLGDGKVEIKDRRTGERREVAVSEVVAQVVADVRA
ncbi:His/Gly/Thr/Pro-type tRNA ligase C-terminal domain-containing protein, partial [Kribbia dieselivorans]|uniref:His/Gly/Thr/Pro-type tRNA ligase C-terminal domain-containing protein n=1 Tax=Kribbia dieselivorans TaxID=331526 RepID=UPI00083984EA